MTPAVLLLSDAFHHELRLVVCLLPIYCVNVDIANFGSFFRFDRNYYIQVTIIQPF